jgi:hypothetical protein
MPRTMATGIDIRHVISLPLNLEDGAGAVFLCITNLHCRYPRYVSSPTRSLGFSDGGIVQPTVHARSGTGMAGRQAGSGALAGAAWLAVPDNFTPQPLTPTNCRPTSPRSKHIQHPDGRSSALHGRGAFTLLRRAAGHSLASRCPLSRTAGG